MVKEMVIVDACDHPNFFGYTLVFGSGFIQPYRFSNNETDNNDLTSELHKQKNQHNRYSFRVWVTSTDKEIDEL